MKKLLPFLLLLSACASQPPAPTLPPPPPAAKASKPQPPEEPKFIVTEAAADGHGVVIASIEPKTAAVTLQNGGTLERVVRVMLQHITLAGQTAMTRYNELADLCIGRGKKVPQPPKKTEVSDGKPAPKSPAK